jgi:ParB family chromosome partitioning protein
VVRRSGLGKGLGALIPTDTGGNGGNGGPTLVEIPVGQIAPNPHQPRKAFDEDTLAGLAASVQELGVLQPILVRPGADGAYELIAGERRWRAAKRAGLATVPAIVRAVDEVTSVEQALVENLHRADLNALEEAAAYQQLIEDFGLTHDELASKVGKSRAAVTNTLRLFQLPPSIQRMVAEGELSAGHARTLLGTPDRAFQESLAKRILAEGLPVRAVEAAVRARNELGGKPSTPNPTASGKSRTLRDPGYADLESFLSEYLETRVHVMPQSKKATGQVVVHFADLEDLERIFRAITEVPEAG